MKPILRDPATGRVLEAVDVVDASSGAILGQVDGDQAMEGLKCGNMTLDTDLYELTMVAGYRMLGKKGQRACFDLYYRQNPDNGGFCVFAGLDSAIGVTGVNTDKDIGFDQVPQHLDMLFAERAEARKGPFGIYGQSI